MLLAWKMQSKSYRRKKMRPTICPACHKAIVPERCLGHTVVCSCGWTKDLSQDKKYIPNTTSLLLVAVASIIILILVHVSQWNTHFLTIIPLKVTQTLGIATTDQLNRLVSICTERQKWNCLIEAKHDLYKKNPEEIKILLDLAMAYVHVQNDQKAASLYHEYFKKGGRQKKAHYEYAKVLTRIGKVNEAIYRYQIILKTQSLLPLETRSYVQLLIDNKKWHQARYVIENYRKKSKSGRLFMETELRQIKRLI